MNNPLRMRGIQTVGRLNRQRQQSLVIQRLARDEMLQGDAVEKLHGNERLLAMFTDFVDGADIGMIQRRRRARLPAKAFQRLRVARKFIRQKFEGNKAAQLGVLRLIDHTHAAATQLFDNAVVRDGLPNHEVEVC